MPAPEVTVTSNYPHPIVKHVNLMVDTYLANATVEESVNQLCSFLVPYLGYSLRCAVRGLLASGTSGTALQFSAAARKHLCESGALLAPRPESLFDKDVGSGEIIPTHTLKEVMARARTVYGVGMGFASLEILIPIVEATRGANWKRDGSTAEILTEVDADIVQAIQSCKEELVSDHLKERGAARQIVSKLQYAIQNCSSEEVLAFEKAAHSIQHWKF